MRYSILQDHLIRNADNKWTSLILKVNDSSRSTTLPSKYKIMDRIKQSMENL